MVRLHVLVPKHGEASPKVRIRDCESRYGEFDSPVSHQICLDAGTVYNAALEAVVWGFESLSGHHYGGLDVR